MGYQREKVLITGPLMSLMTMSLMIWFQNLKGILESCCLVCILEPRHKQLGIPPGPGKVNDRKKPSTWFNEEAGYLAEPPKSFKKKGTLSNCATSTSSKPLFISD